MVRILIFTAAMTAAGGEQLYVARPFTEKGSFTAEIEGPAVDRDGNIYAVSFARKPTIGRVTPDGRGEVFLEMPAGSTGNGIRFDRAGMMYVADYTGHNVLLVNPKTKALTVYAHEPRMNQPNDLAIMRDGTLWASDPNWKAGTGQIWRIDLSRKAVLAAEEMGTTNGIEVSPDEKTLYVNESAQRNVWAFDIARGRRLKNKRLLKQFPDFGFDGMRCDADGNLYITRHGKGVVAVLTPKGEVLREIDVLGKRPSNLCFGGPDGRTVYVTEMEHGRIVSFRVERPGREWKMIR
jgi:sugar lactone lactonase YvrE